ncbi:MAG: response regulator transcription factor [Bacteroidetes bacterium]|nr:response regulator transcription factor [Bacteroidota bacterium]
MENNKQYNILIVDDELQARRLLTAYVEKINTLNLVGATHNVIDAKAIMQKNKVDIILLDIHMPEISGLEFARSLKQKIEVIFTTAYSEYALEGFDLNITDYLIKPIAFNRFFQAISKATDRLVMNHTLSEKENNINSEEAQTDNHIIIRADHKIYKVNYSDLIYIEGQREYVTFHTTTRRITAYYSLKKLEEELPSNLFVRIHKSYIVSLKQIEIVETGGVIINRQSIPIGKNYRNALMDKF